MATIVSERTTCDGHNVRVEFANGRRRILHFAEVPATAELDAAIAAMEQLLEDQAAQQEIADNMEEVLQ